MVYIVPSMGASAVLLFAVPHSALGQLWNVIGCHLISAAIGVACYQWLPSNGIAAGASVGLAIGAMYYTRCIHPPGGATALAAVIGGQNIHALCYQYILTPIAINTTTILLVALLFNALFHWRRILHFCYQKKPKKTTIIAKMHQWIMLILFMHSAKWTLSLMLPLLKIYQLATGRGINSNN